eukprot:TRINITY_DN42793_c0_g1_i1.p1 TRINITY_DN42793_c0_g1~~TRINITY_DN42793_c0_g1_i1.p1  ORF type:complete len:253 (+),score=38.08 TRINITY_DN42793_c0_g1_i1:96-854(+)
MSQAKTFINDLKDKNKKMFEDAPEGLQKYCPFICLSCVGFAAFIMGNFPWYYYEFESTNGAKTFQNIYREYLEDTKSDTQAGKEDFSYKGQMATLYTLMSIVMVLFFCFQCTFCCLTGMRVFPKLYQIITGLPLVGANYKKWTNSQKCRLIMAGVPAIVLFLGIFFFRIRHVPALKSQSQGPEEYWTADFSGSAPEGRSWGPSISFYLAIPVMMCCLPGMCFMDLKTNFGGRTQDEEAVAPRSEGPADQLGL